MPRQLISAVLPLMLFSGASSAPDPTVELLRRGLGTCGVAPGGGGGRAQLAGRDLPRAPRVELEPGHDKDLKFVQWFGIEAAPLSEKIPLRVASGTVGMTIRADAYRRDVLVFVELFGPDGAPLACDGCPGAPAVGQARLGRGTTQMPSTDRPGWELDPGDYTFRVGVRPVGEGLGPVEAVSVDVTAALRTESEVALERLLDLNFVYLPGSTLSEQIARAAPEFAAILEQADVWLAPVGLRIGRVTHNDLDRPEFSFIGTREEAARMFASTSSKVGRSRALNVYCVESFNGELGGVGGLSGGIPGASHNGTKESGIAIKTGPLFLCNCADTYGAFFGHEIGHYLGLYHTTELGHKIWDPLQDTPNCPPDTIADNRCDDWFHVMFPYVGHVHTVWSPAQARIMQSHPLVRTVPIVGARSPAAAAPLRPLASPNPFGASVRFSWTGSPPADHPSVSARIFDLAGRRVRRLDAGQATWNGRTDSGREAPAGVYFVRFDTPQGARTLRIVKFR